MSLYELNAYIPDIKYFALYYTAKIIIILFSMNILRDVGMEDVSSVCTIHGRRAKQFNRPSTSIQPSIHVQLRTKLKYVTGFFADMYGACLVIATAWSKRDDALRTYVLLLQKTAWKYKHPNDVTTSPHKTMIFCQLFIATIFLPHDNAKITWQELHNVHHIQRSLIKQRKQPRKQKESPL